MILTLSNGAMVVFAHAPAIPPETRDVIICEVVFFLCFPFDALCPDSAAAVPCRKSLPRPGCCCASFPWLMTLKFAADAEFPAAAAPAPESPRALISIVLSADLLSARRSAALARI